jgi:hypothetical protein
MGGVIGCAQRHPRRGSATAWRGNVALGTAMVPDYRGSSAVSATLLPLLDLEWRGRTFVSSQRGVGVNLVRRASTAAGGAPYP